MVDFSESREAIIPKLPDNSVLFGGFTKFFTSITEDSRPPYSAGITAFKYSIWSIRSGLNTENSPSIWVGFSIGIPLRRIRF